MDQSGQYTIQPNDLDAEKSVLGALMLDALETGETLELLNKEDFYSPAHKEIFSSIEKLYTEGLNVDVITVTDELVKNGQIDSVGGRNYVWDISNNVPSISNILYYAKIVREKSLRRRIIQAGSHIEKLGFSQDGEEIDDLVEEAQAEIFELSKKSTSSDYRAIGDIIPDVHTYLSNAKNNDAMNGILTGLRDLDDYTNGLKGSQMVVIAARPGVGKSTLANNIAIHAVMNQKKSVVMFNLEMSAQELTMKIISAKADIEFWKLQKGMMTPDDMQKLKNFETAVNTGFDGGKMPLYIDDCVDTTIGQIRTKCRRLASSKEGLDLVIIDYLQLLINGKPAERQAQASAVSRQIKLLAKELDVPVIAVAQLNRESEKGVGVKSARMPQLTDLRETGAIEMDADIVILIHQEQMRYKFERDTDGEPIIENDEDRIKARIHEADILIEKNRSGRKGRVVVTEEMNKARFVNFMNDDS